MRAVESPASGPRSRRTPARLAIIGRSIDEKPKTVPQVIICHGCAERTGRLKMFLCLERIILGDVAFDRLA